MDVYQRIPDFFKANQMVLLSLAGSVRYGSSQAERPGLFGRSFPFVKYLSYQCKMWQNSLKQRRSEEFLYF